MSEMVGLIAALAGLVLLAGGCATLDYCDLQAGARCEWEAKLEKRLNGALGQIGSEARVDMTIACPTDAGCEPPDLSGTFGDETGDLQVLDIPVEPPP